jgi:AraC-like DNA-binding protein
MRDNLGEPLTVDDMARAAMFSKFHFTRIFQRVTGVSPGRFLSALRLQQAQHLLVSTSLNVADISQRVGYNSVGTFSSRFSRSVGMSPTTYRRRSGFAARIISGPDEPCPVSRARVHGQIPADHSDEPRLVFAGLFPDRIPQGQPARCAVLSRPGLFTFTDVPRGVWYLLAQSVPGSLDDPDGYRANINEAVSVASHGPILVAPDSIIRVDLQFNRVRALDPPVLLAMLDVRKVALEIVAGHHGGDRVPALVHDVRHTERTAA